MMLISYFPVARNFPSCNARICLFEYPKFNLFHQKMRLLILFYLLNRFSHAFQLFLVIRQKLIFRFLTKKENIFSLQEARDGFKWYILFTTYSETFCLDSSIRQILHPLVEDPGFAQW